MMTTHVETFDFDIQPSTTHVSGNILPDGEAEVTFQVRNSSDCRQRAEVILELVSGPIGSGMLVDLAYWLQLVEPPEYDYQPQSHRTYTVKIKVTGPVVPGSYSFRLLLVGHDDPDHEYLTSDEVSFNVAVRRVPVLPFVIGGIVVLMLLSIGIIVSLRSSKPASALTIILTHPEEKNVTVGQPMMYQLTLKNTFDITVAENVVMEYTYSPAILGAWVKVEWKDMKGNPITPSGVSTCGSTATMLRCIFEKIEPKQTANLTIYLLPGPLYLSQEISTTTMTATTSSSTIAPPAQILQIDNRGRFTLHWMEDGVHQEDLDLAVDRPLLTLNPINPNEITVSGAAIPAVDNANVGLPVKISLVGWNNTERGGPVFLEYELPQGMRFASYPDECEQQIGKYFILHCTAKSEVPIDIQVIPLQPSTGYTQILRGKEIEKAMYRELIARENAPSLPATINQMVFNGMDEWAQLGYSGLPDTKAFTVEMWVDPYSLEDGQALIGTHRHSPENETIFNQFLVGYYNGSINVNVLGECQNLKLEATDQSNPFHLAVVVKGNTNNNKRKVMVYKNGEQVELDEEVCCRNNCQADEVWDEPKGDEVDFNWVIGQDWDPNGSGIVPSDFFYGAISDVRIFESALNEEQVAENMYLPLSCVKQVMEGQAESLVCYDSRKTRYNLIGWWPLAPANKVAAGPPAECILPKIGELKTETTTDAACVLVDLGLYHYKGVRSGGAWESTGADFGDALVFNGRSALYLNSIMLSEFTENANTAYKGTTIPTPTSSLSPVNTATFAPTPSPSLTNFVISAVSLNGQGNAVMVAPDTLVKVKYDYRIRGIDGCPGCIIELVTGLETSNPEMAPITSDKCAYYGQPGVFPGKSGSENTELKVPGQPGIYNVVVSYLAEYNCNDALSRYGSEGITNKQTVGQITVIIPIASPPVELVATQTALVATQTALVATQTATPTPVTIPNISTEPSEPNGVPVTMAAWIYVDTIPSQQQTILATSFTPENGKVRITLGIADNGHMQVIYQKKGSDAVVVRDEKSIPAGHWINYAVVYWFDKSNGTLSGHNLLLFRDGQQVKASPQPYNGSLNVDIPNGFYLGGIGKSDCDSECFTGRIDEMRIWNRALYKPLGNQTHISPEIVFWQRLPGVAFDEYVYWSFDNHKGIQAQGICQNKTCDTRNLLISGPAWVPNDLSINYSE